MKSNKIWAYLIHLSDNMWTDVVYPTGRNALGNMTGSYSETLKVDYETWRKTIDFLPLQGFNTVLIDVGDAVQYDSHPEISLPNAWSKDKLKEELDHMRSIGLTPIPKLNFSTCHDAWLGEYSRMVSTPKYYQVCEDLIKEVAELFGYPKLFHIGMDEENADMQKSFRYCCIRQKDLWWKDLYFYCDVCEKVGARPWVWSDGVWTYFKKQEEFLQKMPKSVLQSNWWYQNLVFEKDYKVPDFRYEAYLTLNEHGFDQVPTASVCWGRAGNAEQTMELCKKFCDDNLIKGYMTAPWRMTYKQNLYGLMFDAVCFNEGKKHIYPEECE